MLTVVPLNMMVVIAKQSSEYDENLDCMMNLSLH